MEQMAQNYSHAEVSDILDLSRSAYFAHQQKDQRPRSLADKEITLKIQASFRASRCTYGSPRIQQDLRDMGLRHGKNRINRLMKQAGLRPKQKRKFAPLTTQCDPTQRVAENWLARFPTPDKPDQVWQADITYIPTQEGWLYLAGIMDSCSRKIVGYATADELSSSLVTTAWNQAIRSRRPGPGLLHHSDRGSQYTSGDFMSLLQKSGAAASMSRKGNCYDNAHKESFWATLKTECFGYTIATTKHESKRMIFDYIHSFYNSKRRHSSLGYLSPNQFEKNLLNQNHNN